jgi:hypothetical protein
MRREYESAPGGATLGRRVQTTVLYQECVHHDTTFTNWPSRRKQGKIYGKQESYKEVIDVEMPFYLKKNKAFRDM